MKHPLLWLTSVCVIALFIAGFVSLHTATDQYSITTQRTPALVSGITCLVIGSGLLVLGIFKFRDNDRD